ncbi:MAG: hypothetical protein GYB35_08425, partial [Algicola sp.]|nr:hypothetical protein [Algicola sp.]
MKTPNSLRQFIGPKHYVLKVIYTLFLVFLSVNAFSQVPAFPQALGAGKIATGGRGGQVLRVTNLNPSGPGSFKAAMETPGPRIIVFEVSGNIVLNDEIELTMQHSNFTVAGQSAPEGGITITNDFIRLGGGWSDPNSACNNGIFRYIRFRNARYDGSSDNARHNAVVSKGTVGLIFDHCSFSFNDDQAIAIGGVYGDLTDISVQHCIFSENATGIIAGLSGSYQEGRASFINNLFVDQTHRTPNMGGNLQYDIINNVFFNWKSRLCNINGGSPEVNYIGNYLREGSYTDSGATNQVQTGTGTTPTIYTANNYHNTYYTSPQLDDRNLWQLFVNSGSVPNNRFTTTMHPIMGGYSPVSAQVAYTNVLNDVGANKYINEDGSFGTYIDTYDTTKINNTLNSISTNPENTNWTLPTLPNNSRPSNYDTDNDGMADVWENNTFGDLTRTANGDEDNDGYTNIEEFLNGSDTGSNIVFQVEAGDDITICEGETATLTASEAETYTWTPGNMTGASVDVNPTNTTTYTVTGTHSDGSTTTDTLVVTINAIPVADAGNDVEICQGASVILTASGGTSYLWSTSETSESITVSPNSTFTYSVQAFQNGCESETDEITVTVNPLPNVDAGLDLTINLGESTTLTATGADAYEWSTGETTQSITVSPIIETTYTVTGTTGTCENTDSVTVFLTGNEVVANAGEDQTICNGSEITLTATGGVAYVWNTGETTASINVSPENTTTYTVTAYDVTGTISDSDDVVVTVNALPSVDAGADVTITEGESTTLTANGADTYLWNTGETTQSIDVSPASTTTYSVTGFSNGCEASDELTVTVEIETVVVNAGSDVSICEGESVTLTASGGSTYQWNTGETTSSIEVSPNATITYSVTAFNTLGTASDIDDVTVTVNALPSVDAG